MKPAGNYLLARSLFPRVLALLPAEVRGAAVTTEPLSEEQAERLLALTTYDRRRVARTVLQWLNEPPFTARIDNNKQIRALQGEAEGDDHLEEIATAYQWAIDRASQDRWLHLNRGLFLSSAGNPTAAADSFRRVLELLPGSYVAREKLANSLVQLGRFEDAVTEYQELLRRMPYHAPAYLGMGYAQARLGLFDSSIVSYEHAIELHPMYALDAYTNMGTIQLYQRKFDLAAASFVKAIKADSAHLRTAALSHQLSYALEKLGRHSEALRVLQDDARGVPESFKDR
jgi:tetratricopeptide (TPR) repeat protein